MEFYYLNKVQYSKGDIDKTFGFAYKYIEENPCISCVTFLVSTKSQYDFLESLFSAQQLKVGTFKVGRFKVQIRTVRTYVPDYCFEGHEPSEVLIAIAVTPKDLAKFEEKSNIKACFIVPWTLDEYIDFLKVREAKDMETKEPFIVADVDERVKNAIGWHKQVAYPNEEYIHPNDRDKLYDMANALSFLHVPLDLVTVENCAKHLGLSPSSSHITAEAFVKAQSRKLPVSRPMGIEHLTRMMEEEHE